MLDLQQTWVAYLSWGESTDYNTNYNHPINPVFSLSASWFPSLWSLWYFLSDAIANKDGSYRTTLLKRRWMQHCACRGTLCLPYVVSTLCYIKLTSAWQNNINNTPLHDHVVLSAVSCAPLPVPDHTVVNVRDSCSQHRQPAASRCVHKCAVGYVKDSGDEKRMCTADLTWSGDPLQCKPGTLEVYCNRVR